ncbi:MAG TPA: Clp protease N-terminal domain-containing protein, partial [Ktedonobacterales bacterium]
MPTSPTPDPNESHDPYVEVRDGQLYVHGSEVRLERLILAWSRVQAPEALRTQFPSLSLAAIYGAIAYALGHKDELDHLVAEYQQQHPEERAARRWIGTQAHRADDGERPHDEDGALFDHFTERARKVVGLAREEAQRLNHNYIGTEHLLLGLVREGDGVGAKVLQSMGVELPRVRAAVESIIGRGDRIVLDDVGLTPRARKVLELATDEARRYNHHYIGTEHLLLGLVREGDGVAAGVLESLGVNLEKVRAQTIQVLNQSGGMHGSPAGQPAAATTIRSEARGVSDRDRFDKFDARARKTLMLAQEEAQRFNHNYIGTEHLLLGL